MILVFLIAYTVQTYKLDMCILVLLKESHGEAFFLYVFYFTVLLFRFIQNNINVNDKFTL